VFAGRMEQNKKTATLQLLMSPMPEHLLSVVRRNYDITVVKALLSSCLWKSVAGLQSSDQCTYQ